MPDRCDSKINFFTSLDVNECSQVATPCTGSNVRCVNTAGSFFCQCLAGYQAVSGSGTSALTCAGKI